MNASPGGTDHDEQIAARRFGASMFCWGAVAGVIVGYLIGWLLA